MTKVEKLLARFLTKPKDFSFKELVRLMSHFQYIEITKGKTSGSRVAFRNQLTGHIINIHKPHGSLPLKSYQIEIIISQLIKKVRL